MGCDSFYLRGVNIHFDESDDDISCLCTFPHNYTSCGVDPETVYSLALFAAAIKLVIEGKHTGEYLTIPRDIPEWIIADIKKAIKFNKEDE